MRKSKILLVTALALVLCLLCVTTSTFSWLQRPMEDKGNALGWSPSYETSVGKGISMVTYESADDGKTFGETAVSDFSNEGGISPGDRKYYRTDIKNEGNDAQSVSLFLSSVDGLKDSPGKFFLGVNGPLRTYKSYPQSGGAGIPNQKVPRNMMRIYFQPKSNDSSVPDKWKDKEYNVAYGIGGEPNTYEPLIKVSDYLYYRDIPSNATQLFFAIKDWNESQQRTQTFTDIKSDGQSPTQSLVFYLTGNYTSDYNNAYAEKSKVDGANVVNYYSSVTVSVGKSFSAGLIKDTDYIGKTIEYTSSNTSVFTVDSNGNITGKNEGSATLTVKVTGTSYSDTLSVTTNVSVLKDTETSGDSVIDVPIVTNVKVAPATEAGPTVSSVYWYIKNEGSDTLAYTVEDVYLTL